MTLKVTQHKIRRFKRNAENWQDVLRDLKTTGEVSENVADRLENICSGASDEIMKRTLKEHFEEGSRGKVNREKCPPTLRQFALTL